MHIRKLFALFLASLTVMMVFTGCSSYTPGKVKDGVYKNSMFKIATPEGFTCYTGADVEKLSGYSTNYVNSLQRGAQDSFKCEYAAYRGFTQILVCSEDNVMGCSAAEYADYMAKDMQSSKLFDFQVTENKDVQIDGLTFRHLKVVFEASSGTDYYIRQAGTKIIYIYIDYPETISNGDPEKAFAAISSAA